MTQAITLKDIYEELREIKEKMVSKDELARILETADILQNPDTLRQIRSSEDDSRLGRTKAIKGVKDLIAEL
ncbi:MAG TPA: hypothetical protein VJH22_00100 [Candidatus Nanoarchaeia archaeon]|nr:hypothetical protein [Candidatus Nanoarchaeia archaeon]